MCNKARLTFQPFELAVVAHDGLFSGVHPSPERKGHQVTYQDHWDYN